MLDCICDAVGEALPQMNRDLLVNFPKRDVDNAPAFLARAIEESIALLDQAIQFTGWRILDPIERAHYELVERTRAGAQIHTSEMVLVEYGLRVGTIDHKIRVYIPYLKDGYLVIGGIKYALLFGVSEKIFALIRDGIMARVIRAPIKWKYDSMSNGSGKTYRMVSVSETWQSVQMLVLCNLHNRDPKKQNKKIQLTAVHYLLAKHGYEGTLRYFGIDPDEAVFVDHLDDSPDHEFFAAKKPSQEMVFMKVRKLSLMDPLRRHVLATILYTLSHWARQKVSHLYNKDGDIFREFMGEILFNTTDIPQARGQADSHMESVDRYLDPQTQERFENFGLYVKDMYDLMAYVVMNIDKITADPSSRELYNSRIIVIEQILISTIFSALNRQIYGIAKMWPKIAGNPKSISKMVSRIAVTDMAIARLRLSETVQPNPPCYGDNRAGADLLRKVRTTGSGGRKAEGKSRSGGSAVNTKDPLLRYSPGSSVVESSIGFPGKSPGMTGLINPYIPITEHGAIVKPSWAEELEPIRNAL